MHSFYILNLDYAGSSVISQKPILTEYNNLFTISERIFMSYALNKCTFELES
jgi:hypothetical protein